MGSSLEKDLTAVEAGAQEAEGSGCNIVMGDAEKTEPFSQSCTGVEQEAIKKMNIYNSDYIIEGKNLPRRMAEH